MDLLFSSPGGSTLQWGVERSLMCLAIGCAVVFHQTPNFWFHLKRLAISPGHLLTSAH